MLLEIILHFLIKYQKSFKNLDKILERNYQQRLPSNPIKDYYFIHRNTPDTEAVIVEYGFLDSKGDDAIQLKNNYEDYAEAVVRAITEYKGLPYTAPSASDFYTVQKGDSLWIIANKFGLTVDELKALNNLKSNTNIYFAGQITGVEGYVESISSGMVAALNAISKYNGQKQKITFSENVRIHCKNPIENLWKNIKLLF